MDKARSLTDEQVPLAIAYDNGTMIYDGRINYCAECWDGLHSICRGGKCECPHAG